MSSHGPRGSSSKRKTRLPPRLRVDYLSSTSRRYTLERDGRVLGWGDAVLAVVLGVAGNMFAAVVPWWTWLVLLIIVVWFKGSSVRSESILIIPPIGVQLSTTTLLSTRDTFIPMHHIHDVFINESIDCWSVVFYLAVVMDRGPAAMKDGLAEMEVLQVFPSLCPKLKHLLPVWRGMRELLYEEVNSDEEDADD